MTSTRRKFSASLAGSLSAVAIGVYTGVRKVNCHTKGCWRIGRHTLDGTPYSHVVVTSVRHADAIRARLAAKAVPESQITCL